jgi:hypothetical protein
MGSQLLAKCPAVVGAEPRSVGSIKGASGIDHPILAAAVDDARRRLIVVSADPDCRTAALARADMQSALKNVQVLTIRPIAGRVEVQDAGNEFLKFEAEFVKAEAAKRRTHSQKKENKQNSNPADPLIRKIVGPYIQTVHNIQDFALMVSAMGFKSGLRESGYKGPTESLERELLEELPFSMAVPVYHTKDDLKLGICPFLLKEFSVNELDAIQTGAQIDDVRQILSGKGISQYFFPPADQLALGLIDRNHGLSKKSEVAEQVLVAPEIGHPFGPPELTTISSVPEMIEELHDRGLIADGEIGFEVTPQGKAVRATIRFKPREGLVSKILNRISIDLSIKELMGLWKEK